MKRAIELTEQIIILAKARDEELQLLRRQAQPSHLASFGAQGDDTVTHHLKVLRELLLEEDKRLENIIQLNDRNPNNFISSPPLPTWADKLPTILDIGKRVRVKNGYGSFSGWEGVVTKHFICGDDCGDWGRLRYEIEKTNGDAFSAPARDCEFLN